MYHSLSPLADFWTTPAITLVSLRAVEEYHPCFWEIGWTGVLDLRPLGDDVRQYPRFDRCWVLLCEVSGGELDVPLCDSPRGLMVVDDVCEWGATNHRHR